MKKQIKKRGTEKSSSTLRKLSPIKAVMDTTPNYMKSTSSSDAREERGLHVSSRSPQTSSDCKHLIRRKSLKSNRKTSLNSTNKTVVANLTKTPSFKPITTSAKKGSQMIPWENLKVQRATWSSTIKNHEFPAYLNLSPGAIEAEGISSMKVCPYTYCSCNGRHHHDALPPLKSFMLTKRHILKAQRNIKLRCLSPRRKKPVQDIMKEAKVQQWNSQEHPPSGNSSLFQEEHGEYFIEIYSKNKELLSWNNQNIADCSVSDIKVSDDVQDESATDNRKGQQNSIGEYIGGSQNGGGKSIKIDDMINVEKANSPLNNVLFPDGVGKVCDESFSNDIMQELKGDEIAYESWSGDDDSEFISSHKNIYDDENHNRFATDGLDDHLDDMVGVDSAILDINGHAAAMINGAQSNGVLSQKMNQETEDGHYMGRQARSIGTQTDFEDDDIANTCFQMDQVASSPTRMMKRNLDKMKAFQNQHIPVQTELKKHSAQRIGRSMLEAVYLSPRET